MCHVLSCTDLGSVEIVESPVTGWASVTSAGRRGTSPVNVRRRGQVAVVRVVEVVGDVQVLTSAYHLCYCLSQGDQPLVWKTWKHQNFTDVGGMTGFSVREKLWKISKNCVKRLLVSPTYVFCAIYGILCCLLLNIALLGLCYIFTHNSRMLRRS